MGSESQKNNGIWRGSGNNETENNRTIGNKRNVSQDEFEIAKVSQGESEWVRMSQGDIDKSCWVTMSQSESLWLRTEIIPLMLFCSPLSNLFFILSPFHISWSYLLHSCSSYLISFRCFVTLALFLVMSKMWGVGECRECAGWHGGGRPKPVGGLIEGWILGVLRGLWGGDKRWVMETIPCNRCV